MSVRSYTPAYLFAEGRISLPRVAAILDMPVELVEDLGRP